MNISSMQEILTSLQQSLGVALDTAKSLNVQANSYGNENPEMRNALFESEDAQCQYIFRLVQQLIELRIIIENERLKLIIKEGEKFANEWMRNFYKKLDDYYNQATKIWKDMALKKTEDNDIERVREQDNPGL